VTTATGDLAVSTVTAAGGTATLTATTGAITDANGAANNIAATDLVATAATGIDLDTTVATLTAVNTAGAITLNEADGAAVLNVATTGDATVTSATGNLDVTTVTATGGTATLTASTGAIQDANGAANNVTATSLLATAATGIDLDTTVTNLTASNTAVGSVNLNEADGANVLNVSAADGDATVTTTAGDLNVTTVAATNGTATLTAGAGAVADANAGANNVTATGLVATAANGIELDTTVGTLTATNTTAGNLLVRETDALVINGAQTLGGNGNVTVTANGDIDVTGPVAANGAGSVVLTAANNGMLTVGGVISSGTGNVALTADDGIELNVPITIAGNVTFTADADGPDGVGTTNINTGDTNPVTGAVVTFNGPTMLSQPAILTGTVSTTFNANIIGGGNDLTLNSPLTTFNGNVEGTGALTTDNQGAGDTTTINAGIVSGDLQHFTDNVVLETSSVLTGLISVTFEALLDSAAAENNSLTVNSPITVFNGQVGNAAGNTALGTLTTDAAGLTTINTDVVNGATLTFNDPVLLATSTTLTGTARVDFMDTVDSQVTERNDLTVNSPRTQFNGNVGALMQAGGQDGMLGALTTDPAGTTYLNAPVFNTAGGTMTFNDAVVLMQDVTLTDIGGTGVRFFGTLDDDNPAGQSWDLTINTPGGGVTHFGGQVGNAGLGTALGILTTDAAGTTNVNTDVVNAEVLDFNDPVTIDTDTALTGTTSVDFAQTLNSVVGEANDVTINSPVTMFHGIVGGAAGGAVGTLTTDAAGTTAIDTTAVTGAVLDFNDAVVVSQDTTLTGTTSVDFAATLNSDATARDVTINSPTTAFHGVVGGTNALDTLTTDAVGATTIDTIAVTGAVLDFNDAVVVSQDTTLTGTTSVNFAQTLDSDATATDVTVNSPTTAFHGLVGGGSALDVLTTDAAGTTTIDTTAVTGALLDFNDAVVLDQTTTLMGTTSVDFGGTLDSAAGEANSLTVNSPVTAFHGAVGGAAGGALGTLTTDNQGAGDVTTIDTTAMTGAVLAFGDAVVVSQDTALAGTTNVDFAATLDSDATARDVTINSPLTAFHGIVGGGSPLDVLTTDAAGVTVIDTTAVTGAVLDLNDAVVLDQTATLTGTTSGDFGGTVDNAAGEANSLTINSPTTGFHGIVGGTDALGTLTTDAAGTTAIDTTAVTGAVLDFNDAVVASQDTTLTGTTSVDFAATLDSDATARDVTVNSPTTAFHGIVGGASPLDVLTTDAAGVTTIDTTAVSGATLDLNDAVVVSQDTTLTGTTSVDFAATLDSDATARDVTVNSPATAFHGIVGGASPLDVLSTDAAGTTTVDATAVTGAMLDFNDGVVLSQDTTLTGTTSIDFGGTLDSDGTARDVTLNSPATLFHGIVGGASPLDVLNTDPVGTTTIDTTAVTAAVADFNDAVVLESSTNVTGTTSVDFAATVNSAATEQNSLTVTSPLTTFNGNVGTAANGALGSLTTDAAGATTLNAAQFTTAGNTMTFNDAVVLTQDVTLTDTGTTGVTFNSTVDSDATARDLTLNAGTGDVTFAGAVGGTSALDELTINAAQDVTFNGAVNAAGVTQATGTGTTTVNAAVNTTGGTGVALTNTAIAQNADLTAAGASPITVTATTGAITMAAGSSAATDTGTITYTAQGDAAIAALATGGNVAVTATTGAITDVNGAAANVTAANLVAGAATGIDLDTTVTNLTATNTGVGNVIVNETDGANVLNVGAANGNATVTSATGNLNVTTASATGTVTLTATAGAITDANGAANNVAANTLTAASATGVDLDTTVANASATVSGTGGVNLSDADGAVFTDITTANGAITVTAGGTSKLVNVVADGAGNNILGTTTAGDLLVDLVNAKQGNVTLTSAGGIYENPDLDIDIAGNTITLTAVSGIGTPLEAIEIARQTVNAATNTGGIFLNGAGPLTLNNLVSGTGNIVVTTAAGDLILNQLNSGGGLTFTTPGSIVGVAGNLVTVHGASAFTAGGFIGLSQTPALNNAINLVLNGWPLVVISNGGPANLSVALSGNQGQRPLDVVQSAPGLSILNATLIGGAQYGDLDPVFALLDPWSAVTEDDDLFLFLDGIVSGDDVTGRDMIDDRTGN